MFPKIGVFTPPNHPFVHRVFPYFHHLFWGIFGNTHVSEQVFLDCLPWRRNGIVA